MSEKKDLSLPSILVFGSCPRLDFLEFCDFVRAGMVWYGMVLVTRTVSLPDTVPTYQR